MYLFRLASTITMMACLFLASGISVSAPAKASQAEMLTFAFNGADYLHRWSKDGQNEFTPKGQEDLAHWQDMITLNVYEAVSNGDQLAAFANALLSNYRGAGDIVRTDSKPVTLHRPAEHLIVALLGDSKTLVEAVFARLVLIDGKGVVVIYAHRTYGEDAATRMAEWMQKNGPSTEKALMSWEKMPAPTVLQQLPQSK